MKLLVTVVLMLVVATLVADAWLVKRRHRSRFLRRFHRKVIKHPSKSSCSSTNEKRCHILCQKEPLRTRLIKQICPDPCDIVVCQNGGTCNNGLCTCDNGFTGQFCGEIENPCDSPKFCETSSMTCVSGGSPSASCPVQTGQDTLGNCCDDPCDDVVCENGGTCNTTNGECDCVDGFVGDTCQSCRRLPGKSGALNGFDTYEIPDVDDCEQKCLNNTMCISYDSYLGYCDLHDTDIRITPGLVDNPAATVGICTE